MPELHKKNIKKAVNNVASFGDTDIFAFPFGNFLMQKNKEEFISVISHLADNFDDYLRDYPSQFESSLVPTGFQGYRWATQICPFWNVYLLSCLIRYGTEIENCRIDAKLNRVHSYRLVTDDENQDLFSKNYNWRSFMIQSYSEAQKANFIVVTDITEFYRRLNHHRIENSLKQAISSNIPKNIMEILNLFSRGMSYGLPIGGPAARIISELVINQIDHLLVAKKINAVRFADDYHIFTASEEDAHRAIQELSESLILNQGLTLQKSKTRIVPASEFINNFPKHLLANAEPETDRDRLFNLSLNFDPYSPTAEEDYSLLRRSVENIDFMALLNSEIQKSQIHAPTITKLIKALKVTQGRVRTNAIKTIFDNIHTLYPVFSHLMIVLNGLKSDLTVEEAKLIREKIMDLAEAGSHILGLDIHRSFALRLLIDPRDHRANAIITGWFNKGSEFLKRDIIISYACTGGWLQLSDIKNRISGESPWVRRALIVASYVLKEEGSHWRKKQKFNVFEKFVQEASSKLFSSADFGNLL